jgi:hypothetical protein
MGSTGEEVQAKRKMRAENGVNYFLPTLRKAVHQIISKSLLKLQCWSDYLEWDEYLTQRLLMPLRDKSGFEDRLQEIRNAVEARKRAREGTADVYFFEIGLGCVSGKRYPQAAQDVQRNADAFIRKLNADYISGWNWRNDAGIEIQTCDNCPHGLGEFATKVFQPNEVIYSDEPSARGHLDRAERPPKPLEKDHDGNSVEVHRDEEQNFAQTARCENCRRDINNDEIEQRRGAQAAGASVFLCSCSNANIVVKKSFCLRDWRQEIQAQQGQQGVPDTQQQQAAEQPPPQPYAKSHYDHGTEGHCCWGSSPRWIS